MTARAQSTEALRLRLATAMVAGPPLGAAGALALATGKGGVSGTALALLAGLYLWTAIGVEVGFHRYFSHRSFKCGPRLRMVLAAAGSMAGQGTVIYWAAVHRAHHRHADTNLDPHAPSPAGAAGLWRAHVGWLFETSRLADGRGLADLLSDRTTIMAQRLYPLFFLLGLALPALLGGLSGGWTGALEGFLWGGPVRIFLNHHATWSVNSICHSVGSRPYPTRDGSRNLAVLAIPTLGGAWHNNHHAFPASATNDHHWWQLDLAGLLIRAAARAGWAWDVSDLRSARGTLG